MLSLGQVTRPVGHGGRSGDSKEHPAVQFEQSQSNSSASLVERNADDDVHQPQTTSQVKQNKTKQNKTEEHPPWMSRDQYWLVTSLSIRSQSANVYKTATRFRFLPPSLSIPLSLNYYYYHHYYYYFDFSSKKNRYTQSIASSLLEQANEFLRFCVDFVLLSNLITSKRWKVKNWK